MRSTDPEIDQKENNSLELYVCPVLRKMEALQQIGAALKVTAFLLQPAIFFFIITLGTGYARRGYTGAARSDCWSQILPCDLP